MSSEPLAAGAHPPSARTGRGSAPRTSTRGARPTNGKPNGHRQQHSRHQHPDDADLAQAEEPEEIRHLRKKHKINLPTIRELFPSWADEDLLMTLNDAAGDLELAIARISEGHAAQWGAVKSKKDKKASISHAAPAAGATDRAARPVFEGRGRGRGDGSRGARAAGRGSAPRGRGGHSQAVESSQAWVSTPASWEPTSTGWGDTIATSADPQSVDTQANDTDATQDAEATDTVAASPLACADEALPVALVASNNSFAPTKFDKRPVSRLIQPGSKLSWAQIAKPPSPPVNPVPSVATPALPPINNQAKPPVIHELTPPTIHEPTIEIPDPTADVWNATPAAADAPNVWNDDAGLRPTGVGEGWADAVLAQPSNNAVDNAPPEVKSMGGSIFDEGADLPLTPSDAANLGPLELSAPTISQDIDTSPNNADVVEPAASARPAITVESASSRPSPNLAPPGLVKRGSSRAKGQEAAVVMPGSGSNSSAAADRMGLQFGSLSFLDQSLATPPVFENTTENVAREVPAPEAKPDQPVLTSVQAEVAAPTSVSTSALNSHPPTTQVTAPETKTPYSQPPASQSTQSMYTAPGSGYTAVQQQSYQPQHSQAQQQQSAFAARYSSSQPHQQQYTAPELSHPAQSNQTQQQGQHQTHQDSFAQSSYGRFGQAPETNSALYSQQHTGVASGLGNTLTPQHTQSQPQQSAYGGFNSAVQQAQGQQQPQQQQPPHSASGQSVPSQPQTQQSIGSAYSQHHHSAQDYAALYGGDALRSYYDAYAHTPASAGGYPSQSRFPHSAVEDKATAVHPTSQQNQPGPAQQHQHQQQAASAPQHQYPGVAPSIPYPYYHYYSQYGQVPPYGQSPSYGYGMGAPSPYYSAQVYPAQPNPSAYGQQGSQQLQTHSTGHQMGSSGMAGPNTGQQRATHTSVLAGQSTGQGSNTSLSGYRSSTGIPQSHLSSSQGLGAVHHQSHHQAQQHQLHAGSQGGGGTHSSHHQAQTHHHHGPTSSQQQQTAQQQQSAVAYSSYGSYGGYESATHSHPHSHPHATQAGRGGGGSATNATSSQAGPQSQHQHQQGSAATGAGQQSSASGVVGGQGNGAAGAGVNGQVGSAGPQDRKDPFGFSSDRFF